MNMQVVHTAINMDIWTRVWICRSWTRLCMWTSGDRYEHAGRVHGYVCGHLDTGINMHVVGMAMYVDIWTQV